MMPDGAREAHLCEMVKKVTAARERACEVAIQTGGCGVLETWHADGSVSFDVTAQVPYGNVYIKREGTD